MQDLDHNSGAVQSYLGILQGVIGRMASNSASCKTWCITIVSAILATAAGKSNADYVWVAALPISLFLFLDSYYLGLEQRFRDSYNSFIRKLHSKTATIEDVYIVSPGAGLWLNFKSTSKAILSVSVMPFYALLFGMLYLVHKFVLG